MRLAWTLAAVMNALVWRQYMTAPSPAVVECPRCEIYIEAPPIHEAVEPGRRVIRPRACALYVVRGKGVGCAALVEEEYAIAYQ